MKIRAGDLITMDMPFVEGGESKIRPVVVVSSEEWNQASRDLVVMPLTSEPGDAAARRVELPNWRALGLREPSWIKPVVMTVLKKQLRRRIGPLDESSMALLQQLIGDILMPIPSDSGN